MLPNIKINTVLLIVFIGIMHLMALSKVIIIEMNNNILILRIG